MGTHSDILVSVIMPVYNVGKYLKKAVDAIAGQNFKNFEIILVNDGSVDNSGEICDELKEKDERITVIHKENGGCSSARNAGIDIAKGKYIYFMDPDDYCVGELLEENISIAEKYGCSQVVFGFVNALYDEKKEMEISRKFYYHCMEGHYSFEDFKSIFSEHLNNIHHVVWNRIYTKESIGDTRFSENLNTAEDAVFNLELIKKGFDSIYYNNKCYYVYLCRKDSLMNKYNPRRFENELLITDMIKRLVKEWQMAEQFEKYILLKYAETVLSEYGNMSMHDSVLHDKDKIQIIKKHCSDERVVAALRTLSADDFDGIGMKGLFVFTAKGKYKSALYFKRIITALSVFVRKMMLCLNRKNY